jgi:hypothetical protein
MGIHPRLALLARRDRKRYARQTDTFPDAVLRAASLEALRAALDCANRQTPAREPLAILAGHQQCHGT